MALFRRRKVEVLEPQRFSGQKLLDGDGLSVVSMPPDWLSNWQWNTIYRHSYGHLYRSQPNVRAVIDFLAQEVAGVKLKLFEKLPTSLDLPDSRVERSDHPMMKLLNNPGTLSRTKLWKHTVSDFYIYNRAYWLKLRVNNNVVGLARVPPINLNIRRDALTGRITEYRDMFNNIILRSDLIIFEGYDPERYEGFVSPLETLRRILAEEWEAGENRRGMWRNGARREGLIERPLEAPKWSPDAREAFRADFKATMSGSHNAGEVGILEDGMTWNADGFNPQEMEYLGAREATRKECAALFGVDPKLVFASAEPRPVAEARTAFYVDKLVPTLAEFSEEIDMQLLPDFEPLDYDNYYTEFNIDAKLKGSFEEQARIASSAVGGPYVTVNEMRARVNLPPVEGGQALFIPLNSIRAGGPQASPQSPVQTPGVQPTDITPGGGVMPQAASITFSLAGGELKQAAQTPPSDVLRSAPRAALRRRQATADKYAAVLEKHLKRQAKTILPMARSLRKSNAKMPQSIEMIWGDDSRWNLSLAKDLQLLTESVVDDNAKRAITQLKRKAAYDPQRTRKYISVASVNTAQRINDKTKADVAQALSDESGDELDAVFTNTERASIVGLTLGTAFVNFGRTEGAQQGGGTTKTWIVTSGNSRHPEMNGEQVGIRDQFSNGLDYPGQYGDPHESAGCQCLLDVQ